MTKHPTDEYIDAWLTSGPYSVAGRDIRPLLNEVKALREALREALAIIDGLRDQQAMPDDSLDERMAALRAALAAAPAREDARLAGLRYVREIAEAGGVAAFNRMHADARDDTVP